MTAAQHAHKGTPARMTQPAIPAGSGRLRETRRRIRLTIQEMDYESRRVVELRAPRSIDQQWHGK